MSLTIKQREVIDHFNHGDIDLARRRFLDVVYDQNNLDLLSRATQLSAAFSRTDDAESFRKNAVELFENVKSSESNEKANHEPLLSAGSVNKTYTGGNFSLINIDLSISPGQILGVVGENGNGKTTLLRCLAGQLDGDIPMDAYSYVPKSSQPFYTLKQHTGFIPQRIPRWYGKLRNNLHFSASIAGITGEDNSIIVDFILERFGLTRYAELTWNQISSGYRTRFEIARVVLQRPRLLVLDEPLANLDINAQQTLLQDLKFIAKSDLHPLGLVISSQQLYEIEKVSDRVLFIKNGKGMYNFDSADVETDGAAERIFTLEFECVQNRNEIESLLKDCYNEMKYNGGVYQITTHLESGEILKRLIAGNITPGYFRDISKSTKRFF